MNNFLDNFYGVLFNPKETFERLKNEPSLAQSAVIVFIVSILAPVLDSSINSVPDLLPLLFKVFNSAFGGFLSWLFFAAFLEIIAGIFRKGGKIKSFLCLSAFALLPWLFIAPVELFKTGGTLIKVIGILLGYLVWLWTTVLTAYAVMKTYEITPARLISFLLVPSFGFILSLCWIVGFFTTLIQIVH